MSTRSGSELRKRRQQRVRKKVAGTTARPRLVVFRSARHIYAQVIDDAKGHTLAAASTVADKITGAKKDAAAKVGELVAERAKSAGIETVVFDRGGFLYHGRVAAIAEAARKAGLKF